MKSWVSSAFSDDKPVRLASSSQTTRAPLKTTTSASLNCIDVIDLTKPLLTKAPAARALPKAPRSDSVLQRPAVSSVSLADKYQPAQRADLVVNKTKIEQLSSALDSMMAKRVGSIMIIEGPPGCGKSATLKVLCKEKGVELVTWNSENLRVKGLDMDDSAESNNNFSFVNYESQSKLFHQFLYKSSRYLTDQLFESDENSCRTHKLLFIKEVPNFAYRDLATFHSMLRSFCKYSKYSLVFSMITSSSTSNDSNPAKIFPMDLRKELGVVEVNFNAFANSYLSKELDKIARAENLANLVDKAAIEQLCLISNGDLRYAINLMELTYVQHKSASSASSSQVTKTTAKKRTRAKAADPSESKAKSTSKQAEGGVFQFTNCKDTNLSIFRGLGKVLHRKTLESSEEHREKFAAESKLPRKLSAQYRKPFTCDPEDIFQKLPISAETLTLYLHQNYIEIFAKKTADKRFEDVFASLDSINSNYMLSDMISSRVLGAYVDSGSSYNQHSLINELSALVSMRSVLFNSAPSAEDDSDALEESTRWRGAGAGGPKGVWMPLRKPFHYKTIELSAQKGKYLRGLVLNNENFCKCLIEIKSEMFTTYLPYMIAMQTAPNGRAKARSDLGLLSPRDVAFLRFNRQSNMKYRNSSDEMIRGDNDLIPSDELKDRDDGEPVVSTANSTAAAEEIKAAYEYENQRILNMIDEPF